MSSSGRKLFKFNGWVYIALVLFSASALFAVGSLFSSCYTVKQSVIMIGYLNRAIPLEQAADKEFVQSVQDIRHFAMEELGLAMSKNYTRYVEINRDYLAAVVSASAKDSFRRHEWRFPVVGSMPYKGFFNIDDAKKERIKLENRDLDVWIRHVDAFSTLGWFTDPLYSYMRNYSTGNLANLIIHELVHATVFIKGQMQFNEELAEFIGSEGARLYMETRYGADSEEYQKMFTAEDDNKKFVAFLHDLINELNILYSRQPKTTDGRKALLAEKEIIISDAKERFDAEYENNFSSARYRNFLTMPINNAYLELYRLYYADDNFYEELYERSGRNLPAFIEAAKTITKKGNPREQLEKALLLPVAAD